jgi:hypothetical protein
VKHEETRTKPARSNRFEPPTKPVNTDDRTGLLVGAGTDMLRLDRSSVSPLAPFSASIAASWSGLDASEASVLGNGSVATPSRLVFSAICFDAGGQFRFGVLRMVPA